MSRKVDWRRVSSWSRDSRRLARKASAASRIPAIPFLLGERREGDFRAGEVAQLYVLDDPADALFAKRFKVIFKEVIDVAKVELILGLRACFHYVGSLIRVELPLVVLDV